MDFNITSPKNKAGLLKAMKEEKSFRFGAGYTDLLMELKKQDEVPFTVINLAQLNEKTFTEIHKISGGLRIGSLVTAATIVTNKFIIDHFPVLQQAAHSLASNQIRQVATLGGNLCTASPSGDMACALMALEAECEILSVNGDVRLVPIAEFFTGPRKTVLKKKEILRSVLIPLTEKKNGIHSGFIKVGTRRSMECSVVSLAYHIHTDKNGLVTQSGVAIGASAPTIRFAKSACDLIAGNSFKNISQQKKEEFANKVVSYASPITDIRATAWYRKEVLFNISKSIFE
jgi:CO/xanthine dehydrogenase FAD-binding subunit